MLLSFCIFLFLDDNKSIQWVLICYGRTSCMLKELFSENNLGYSFLYLDKNNSFQQSKNNTSLCFKNKTNCFQDSVEQIDPKFTSSCQQQLTDTYSCRHQATTIKTKHSKYKLQAGRFIRHDLSFIIHYLFKFKITLQGKDELTSSNHQISQISKLPFHQLRKF